MKSQASKTGFTDSTENLQLIIGNDALNIPANHIRYAHQRKGTTPKQVDLVLLWPSGAGFTNELSTRFQDTSETANVIYITLIKRNVRLDMNGRLEPVYSKLFTGTPSKGSNGLYFQPLQKGVGYDGEQLVISNVNNNLWVARCQLKSSPTRPTCMRDIFIGNSLSLQYRFPLHLLEQWQAVEQLVHQKISPMISN